MKRSNLAALLTVLSVLVTRDARAESFPDPPGEAEYVVDLADIVDDAARAEIDRLGASLWESEGVPLTVVTVVSLVAQGVDGEAAEHDAALAAYAEELFDRWEVGGDRSEYGIVVVVSRDDKRVHVELGSGWGGRPSERARHIVDTVVAPEFREGRFGAGLVAAVEHLDAVARGRDLAARSSSWWYGPFVLITSLLAMAVIISLCRSGRHGWGWAGLSCVGTACATVSRAAVEKARTHLKKEDEADEVSEAGATGLW